MTTAAHALDFSKEPDLLLQEPLWHKELAVCFSYQEMESFYAWMQPIAAPACDTHEGSAELLVEKALLKPTP
jgi:hypothetical protein